MSITESQLAAKRSQLEAESAEVDRQLADAVSTKNYSGLSEMENRINQLAEQRGELDLAEARFNATSRHPLNPFGAASAAGEQGAGVAMDARAMKSGRAVSPLGISDAAMKSLYAAASSRQSLSVKAFSTVDGLLPAQLDPNVLAQQHESRLLDRLPTQSISAPSYEIIVHSSTTGAPGPTAEGAVKPEIVLNTTSQTLTVVKLACHLGISTETLMDFSNFQSYAQVEMLKQVEDTENTQLLSGSGTGGNMAGFLHTTGILTHDASLDTGTGVTVIDSIEKSITALRVGAALATADLLILHPATWSAIRRLKDSTGRFLFIASDSDPTRAEANSIFNVPVLTTTALAAGAGVMLDSQKFGRVLVREGITVHTGTNTDDLVRNIVRFVMEERLVLAVERPSAVLSITNLPTA
jgi:HK97 family phage major capsid protein